MTTNTRITVQLSHHNRLINIWKSEIKTFLSFITSNVSVLFLLSEMATFEEFSKDITRLTYTVPTRGLLGYESKLRSDTRGTGRLCRRFESYRPMNMDVADDRIFPLIATHSGRATQYALLNLEPRVKTFYVSPGDEVYEGMIIGETNKPYDMEGNACKAKQLTNIRSNSKEETVHLKSAQRLQLDEILTKIQTDELLEVTPKSIRLRKAHLSASVRKSLKKKGLSGAV